MINISSLNKNIQHSFKNTSTSEEAFSPKVMISQSQMQTFELKVFYHHIYEYKKGVRNLILCTEKTKNRKVIEERLKRDSIPYFITQVSDSKINVFFGKKECIDVVKKFNNTNLTKLTDEQDFMLGIMLGYDRLQQCLRYLKRKSEK